MTRQKMRSCFCFALYCTAIATLAQEPPAKGIQDNSFLVEEAYNQEPGVVQHINLFQRNLHTGEWQATFTQEYPVPGIRHQLSYTVLYQRLNTGGGKATGLGDLALNYRYQLVGDGEARVAVAPRLTLLFPAGDNRRALGSGSTGVQTLLPVSTVLSEQWVAHWNAGATFVPSARNPRGEKADTFGYNFGGSVIWLGRAFNVLVETVWSSAQSVAGPGRTERTTSFFVSPGVRWAYDFPSGLQIVPGLGVPIGLGSSRGQYALLLYLSFEHPFHEAPQKR
jgi:outer membrane putative beta-barrel porin/alpha-amylase